MRQHVVLGWLGTLTTLVWAGLWLAPIALFFARTMSLEAFTVTLRQTLVLRWILNSLMTSITVSLLVVVLCAACAYALSQLSFSGKTVLYWIFLAGIMIPHEALLVPQFILMYQLHSLDTYQGIILPQLIAPIAIVIFKRYFDGVPSELRDAAVLEGAGELYILTSIYLPVSQTVVWAVAVYTFITSWNAFFWPFLVTFSEQMWTIPVGLADRYSFAVLFMTVVVAVVLTAFAHLRLLNSGTSRIGVSR